MYSATISLLLIWTLNIMLNPSQIIRRLAFLTPNLTIRLIEIFV